MPITLVSNGLLDAAGAAAFVALLVQQTKFLVEYAVKPTDPHHDGMIRLYVDLVAMAVVIVAGVVSGTLNVHNGEAWFTAVVQGFGVAVVAISGYHILNGMQPQTPSVPPAMSQSAQIPDDSAMLAALQRILANSAATALHQVLTSAAPESLSQPAPVLDSAPAAAPSIPAQPSVATSDTRPPSTSTDAAEHPDHVNGANEILGSSIGQASSSEGFVIKRAYAPFVESSN